MVNAQGPPVNIHCTSVVGRYWVTDVEVSITFRSSSLSLAAPSVVPYTIAREGVCATACT